MKMAEYPIAQSDLLGVPIGTIRAYAGPLSPNTLRDRWKLCNGTVVNDPASPLNGLQVPNLSDNRFLMGVAQPADINVGAGSNDLSNDGSHSHAGATAGFAGYQQGEINFDRGPGHQDAFMPRYGISGD